MIYFKIKRVKKEIAFYWIDTKRGVRYFTSGPNTIRSFFRWLKYFPKL